MLHDSHLISLIAAPDGDPIDFADIAALIARDPGSSALRWLSPGRACEFSIGGSAVELADTVDRLRNHLDDRHVDVNLVAASNRRKRLLIADMDSTMVEQETLDEIAAAVGLGEAVARITRQSMAGELDFSQALRARIAMLAGTPRGAIDRIAGEITYVPGAATLVATMRTHGASTALVSGGFTDIVGAAARTLGFDTYRANRFVFDNDTIIGVEEPILDQNAKLDALHRLTGEQRIGLDDTLAVGDGANDIPMLDAAGLGVAYRGKPHVRSRTPVQINHADLTALLYLQGYEDGEINRAV